METNTAPCALKVFELTLGQETEFRPNSDPLNVTNDVGRSTYQWNMVRTCFDHCCRKLKKALEEQPDPAMRGGTLLGQILNVPHELLIYRFTINNCLLCTGG